MAGKNATAQNALDPRPRRHGVRIGTALLEAVVQVLPTLQNMAAASEATPAVIQGPGELRN
jgi:hypothetical protein